VALARPAEHERRVISAAKLRELVARHRQKIAGRADADLAAGRSSAATAARAVEHAADLAAASAERHLSRYGPRPAPHVKVLVPGRVWNRAARRQRGRLNPDWQPRPPKDLRRGPYGDPAGGGRVETPSARRRRKRGEQRALAAGGHDLTEAVAAHTTLTPSGSRLKGLCPFHPEKTPSFTVDPDRGLYHCFGCGEGGDVHTFLRKIRDRPAKGV
jgi:hypothetical protein